MVAQRGGDIRVVKHGITLARPFLSIPGVDASGEGGLLSLAFSPDYVSSGRFYVFLTPADANPGAAPHAPIQIREYRRSAADPDVAAADSRRDVLTIGHPDFSNHYGGSLQFGPDGLLYASTGDGGGSGDPDNRAEDPASPLGKLLRLDPRQDGASPYRVPPGNPYAGGAGGHPLVFSLGLRNPFRFSFDRQTGDLTIGDVGQNTVEEIDYVPAVAGAGHGADFGWNTCEGRLSYPNTSNACPFDHVEPVHTYPNLSDPCASITGGVVVRDPGLEELFGRYVYGDYCHSWLRSIQLATPTAAGDSPLSVTVPPFTLAAFGEDACGRVHVVELAGAGHVRRLGDESPSGCEQRVAYPSAPASVVALVAEAAGSPFSVALGGARRQRPLRSGNVGVKVRCSAACSVRALGRLSLRVKGRRVRLREGRGRRTDAGTLALRLRLPARARRPLLRALRVRKPVRAALTVRVRDSKGALTVRARTVRLAR